MSAYVDPATALRLAHQARAADIRRGAQRRQERALNRSTVDGRPARGHRLGAAVARLGRRAAHPVPA